MPDIPPALKQAWIRVLRRENFDFLKVVNVCVKHPLEFDSDSQFKLLELTDRGELKYPSEPVPSCAITLWRILVSIENSDELSNLLVDGPSRKILVELG